MKNYVISLTSEHKRRAHITEEFGKQQIRFDFFDALTPAEAQPLAQKLALNVDDSHLTSGELACFMSHVSLWQKVVDEGMDFLAIFEDDIYLGNNAAWFLNQSSWIEAEWDLIKLEKFSDKVFFGNEIQQFDTTPKRTLYKLEGKNLGAAGYIISQKTAIYLLDAIKNLDCLIPLDELLFFQTLNSKHLAAFQLEPNLCIQEMILFPDKSKHQLESKLFSERKARMKNNKKKGMVKLKHEVLRLFKQGKKITNASDSNFE